jgi:hypothetical protein
MRRIIVSMTATIAAFGLAVGPGFPASAMEPPGGPAQVRFGCPDPVSGHPGAAGIVDATTRVGSLTGSTHPTAWNSVEHADPISLGTCPNG